MESPFASPTFERDGSFRVDEPVGAMSISPSGRDVVLASRRGLHIIDLDNPYDPPRYIQHEVDWEITDVQWSPFASRDHWVVSTSNHVALVWDLRAATPQRAIDHALHGREGHNRAITDINFSAHDPEMVATCGVDSFVLTWDLRQPQRPAQKYADWQAGAQQVKFNRKDPHILASAHNNRLHIWDDRKGASPLHTIQAHTTKIYGIDWNRTEAMSILTCSLDKTIKLWNLADRDLKPHRIMRVGYQVWRARHTPFGMGILAMPHRDNHGVHLYDRRTYRIADRDSAVEPIHQFDGHVQNVREFLWRPRGVIEDGRDHRDFQLVTWGSDNRLLLHRINSDLLSKVGFRKGAHFPDGDINFTRRGAVYRSFHNLKASPKRASDRNVSASASGADSDQRASPARTSSRNTLRRLNSEGITPPSSRKGQADALTWIKGVKIHRFDNVTGERVQTSSEKNGKGVWTEPDDLGAEVAWVSEKLPEIEIQEPDVRARRCVVAFDAPWTEEGKKCWVKCAIHFPPGYPTSKEIAEFDFDWPAIISEATKTRLTYQLQALLFIYADAGRGSLEAALRFLLGHRTFEQSSTVDFYETAAPDSARDEMFEDVGEHDDDGEDEEEGGEAAESVGSIIGPDLDQSATVSNTTHLNTNANVPLPKACGAVFAPNGKLVCFFPSKKPTVLEAFIPKPRKQEEPRDSETTKAFEEFQRLNFGPTALLSHHSSSSSSSSADEEESSPILQHNPTVTYGRDFPAHFALRHEHFRDDDSAHNDPNSVVSGSYIAVHSLSGVVSSSLRLARDYKIVGRGDEVCSHNAAVAKRFGKHEVSNTWEQLALILARNVPLKWATLYDGSEALVIDTRPLPNSNRPDSGNAQDGGDADQHEKEQLRGRVKWFGHPLGGSGSHPSRGSLIRGIIRRYEDAGDVQMLGMLACILAPAPAGATGSFLTQYPSYNPVYYASVDVANSVRLQAQRTIEVAESYRPARPQRAAPPPGILRSGSSLSSSMPSSWSRSLAWLTSTPSSPQSHTPAFVESNSDDDSGGELLPMPTSTVTVRLTNQDKFEEGAANDFPFLLRKEDGRHRAWRSMYANELQAWSLFTARCEVLKFGGLESASTATDGVDEYRCRLSLRCAACKKEVPQQSSGYRDEHKTSRPSKRCPDCNVALRLPACTLCAETIRGLVVPCLQCGHVTHGRCLRAWHAHGGADAAMCAAGCGCECFGGGAAGPVEEIDATKWAWDGVE